MQRIDLNEWINENTYGKWDGDDGRRGIDAILWLGIHLLSLSPFPHSHLIRTIYICKLSSSSETENHIPQFWQELMDLKFEDFEFWLGVN
jgi:hypothetical protein